MFKAEISERKGNFLTNFSLKATCIRLVSLISTMKIICDFMNGAGDDLQRYVCLFYVLWEHR